MDETRAHLLQRERRISGGRGPAFHVSAPGRTIPPMAGAAKEGPLTVHEWAVLFAMALFCVAVWTAIGAAIYWRLHR